MKVVFCRFYSFLKVFFEVLLVNLFIEKLLNSSPNVFFRKLMTLKQNYLHDVWSYKMYFIPL